MNPVQKRETGRVMIPTGSRSRRRSLRVVSSWAAWMEQEAGAIETALRRLLPASGPGPASLRQAMRHAVFPGGKRLRPALAVLGNRYCGGKGETIYRLAASLELVHTFTLIHDDLPCMDDDAYRRGRPTCHRVYGEALAVLAGDALLNLSYRILIDLEAEPAAKETILATFAEAVGIEGVLGGQVKDIEAEGSSVSEPALRQIHQRKTASLITASLMMGGQLAGGSSAELRSLEQFGQQMGLLFQLVDDLLNVEGTAEVLGRPGGSDERLKKATYPRVLGLARARERLDRREAETRRIAKGFGAWSGLFDDLVRSVTCRLGNGRGKEEA